MTSGFNYLKGLRNEMNFTNLNRDISLFYCRCQNFGDELNVSLLKKLKDTNIRYASDPSNIEYIGIGSILHTKGICFHSDSSIKHSIKNLLWKIKTWPKRKKKIIVLSAGFGLVNPNEKIKFIRPMDFRIVRGKKTLSLLKKNGYNCENTTLGDLGLLSNTLLETPSEKNYDLGIVPHFRDINHPLFWNIYKKKQPNCLFINVQDPPEKVIFEIAQCRKIVSSSLHGLIVADALCIPNMWLENPYVRYDKAYQEYRFKYEDYYSAFSEKKMVPTNILDFLYNNKDEFLVGGCVNGKELIQKKQLELQNTINKIF